MSEETRDNCKCEPIRPYNFIKTVYAKGEIVDKCCKCETRFSILNWRYSCDNCNKIFCRNCCQYQDPPVHHTVGKYTLCDNCIYYRHHGNSEWCKMYNKYIVEHGYLDMWNHRGNRYIYRCEYDTEHILELGNDCRGHWG